MCSSVGVVGLMQVTFPHSAARSRRMTPQGMPRAPSEGWHPARAGPQCSGGRGNLSMSLKKSGVGTSAISFSR